MRFAPLPPLANRAAMAEWLRRLTRNQMGSSRVGSNPTRSELDEKPFLFFGEDKKYADIHTRLEKRSCDGRVVKALDLKSNGIFPRRFEPYSQRRFFKRQHN